MSGYYGFPMNKHDQEPSGGPEEDPTCGFTVGGWLVSYRDESMDTSLRVSTTRIAICCSGAGTSLIDEFCEEVIACGR